MTGDHASPKATLAGGLFHVGGRAVQLLLVDSITEALDSGAGRIVVSGSHGGTSAGHFALQARPALVVFNDAGVGKDAAGIAALPGRRDVLRECLQSACSKSCAYCSAVGLTGVPKCARSPSA